LFNLKIFLNLLELIIDIKSSDIDVAMNLVFTKTRIIKIKKEAD